MPLSDIVTLRTGEKFSEVWYQEVWRKLFIPRACSRCKETKDTLGVFMRGTTKYATSLIFGFPQEVAEKLIVILELDALCQECFNKLRYNGSGPPPHYWSRSPETRRKLDG
jgi:hypothetical protein